MSEFSPETTGTCEQEKPRLRVLLADDHKDLRDVVKLMLEDLAGWEVCGEAINGVEAVAKATELKPDAIILDLSMPKMDGLQAAGRISASFPNTPILLYTNYALLSDVRVQAKKSGVWEVLSKGASPAELINTVEALHRRATERAL